MVVVVVFVMARAIEWSELWASVGKNDTLEVLKFILPEATFYHECYSTGN